MNEIGLLIALVGCILLCIILINIPSLNSKQQPKGGEEQATFELIDTLVPSKKLTNENLSRLKLLLHPPIPKTKSGQLLALHIRRMTSSLSPILSKELSLLIPQAISKARQLSSTETPPTILELIILRRDIIQAIHEPIEPASGSLLLQLPHFTLELALRCFKVSNGMISTPFQLSSLSHSSRISFLKQEIGITNEIILDDIEKVLNSTFSRSISILKCIIVEEQELIMDGKQAIFPPNSILTLNLSCIMNSLEQKQVVENCNSNLKHNVQIIDEKDDDEDEGFYAILTRSRDVVAQSAIKLNGLRNIGKKCKAVFKFKASEFIGDHCWSLTILSDTYLGMDISTQVRFSIGNPLQRPLNQQQNLRLSQHSSAFKFSLAASSPLSRSNGLLRSSFTSLSSSSNSDMSYDSESSNNDSEYESDNSSVSSSDDQKTE